MSPNSTQTPQARTPQRRVRASVSQSFATRVETRSMARASAAYARALSTPPRTIRTYRTRNRTIAPDLETPSIARTDTAYAHILPTPPRTIRTYRIRGQTVVPDTGSNSSPESTPARTYASRTRRLAQAQVLERIGSNSPEPHADVEVHDASEVDLISPATPLPLGTKDEGLLTKVAEGLKLSSRCDICYMLMQRPFTLECGHSACGPCLHRHFSSILGPRVQAINRNIPRTTKELEHVVQAAWSAGVLPRMVFSYICPTCREPIRRPPADHISLKSLISTIRTTLKDRPDLLKDEMGWVDESAITGTGYFTGLFLEKK